MATLLEAQHVHVQLICIWVTSFCRPQNFKWRIEKTTQNFPWKRAYEKSPEEERKNMREDVRTKKKKRRETWGEIGIVRRRERERKVFVFAHWSREREVGRGRRRRRRKGKEKTAVPPSFILLSFFLVFSRRFIGCFFTGNLGQWANIALSLSLSSSSFALPPPPAQ